MPHETTQQCSITGLQPLSYSFLPGAASLFFLFCLNEKWKDSAALGSEQVDPH